MNRIFALGLLLLLTAGCATPTASLHPLDRARLSPDAFITQRAILTARGREFTLNGYLARSQAGGLRLIMSEMLGQVLADVLIKPNGTVFVIRSSPMMRPEWIRRYVAADVASMFGGVPDETGAVQSVGPDQFVVNRRWYKLYLRSVETRPGPQPPDLFDETSPQRR